MSRDLTSRDLTSRDFLPFDLNDTVSATWRRRLAGPDGTRVHWRTKTHYYRAAARLLRDRPTQPLGWRDIVGAVRPRGSRSTFYEVTGPGSKHALMDEFEATGQADSLQIALFFRRENAVEQLIDETKVWSYWPFREGWVSACHSEPDITVARATDALVVVLSAWARREPELAAALDHGPPACAVEDLTRLHRGQLPALRASATLKRAMLSVAGPSGDLLDLDGEPEVDPRSPAQSPIEPPVPENLLVGLAENIYALHRETPRMAPADARTIRETMLVLMADAVGQAG
jgi:hypothetical protein